MKRTKKSIIKTIAVSFVAVFLLAGLAGCSEDDKKDDKAKDSSSEVASSKDSSKKEDDSKETTEMSDEALDEKTKDEYTKKAEDDVKLLNDDKIDEVKKQFDTTLKDTFTEVNETQLSDIVKKAGTFDKFEETDAKEDGDNIVTMTTAKYENADLTFTISYNKESKEIAGIYIK